jgi:hypothetical protein
VKFRVSEAPFHAFWGKIFLNSNGLKTTYNRKAKFYNYLNWTSGFFVFTQQSIFVHEIIGYVIHLAYKIAFLIQYLIFSYSI